MNELVILECGPHVTHIVGEISAILKAERGEGLRKSEQGKEGGRKVITLKARAGSKKEQRLLGLVLENIGVKSPHLAEYSSHDDTRTRKFRL